MNVRLRSAITWVFTAVAVFVAGGCGGGPGGPPGTVHGAIVLSGGPPGAPPGGAPGTVVVTHGGAEVGRQQVADGRQFTFSLSPGRYRLSVRGVDGACVATDVTVTAGSDQSVDLVCQRK